MRIPTFKKHDLNDEQKKELEYILQKTKNYIDEQKDSITSFIGEDGSWRFRVDTKNFNIFIRIELND